MNERLNIRRMQVPESQDEEKLFDPKDLTASDWGLIKQAEIEVKAQNTSTIAIVAALEKQLPNSKYVAEILADDWKWIDAYLDAAKGDEQWWNFLRIAAGVHVAAPEHTPSITPQEWDMIETRWRDYRFSNKAANGPRAFIDMILQMKVLGHEPPLTEEDEAFITEYATDVADLGELAIIKTFAPEKVSPLPKEQAEKAVAYLDVCRQEGMARNFLERVFDLTVLSADEIKITDHGLEITMRKPKHNEGAADMPQTLEL